MKTIKIKYHQVDVCPLCGTSSEDSAKLTRANYFFGKYIIPLPEGGVFLRQCKRCSLLFKSAIPDRAEFARVMLLAASDVWRSKSGTHPALDWVLPYVIGLPKSILDVGASNGDLLAQLKPFGRRVSALDVVPYSRCHAVVDGEYIISEIDSDLVWSGEKYDIVTAFDIFEHFLDTHAALKNISNMVTEGGILIIETGDWNFSESKLNDWYYANLFEHQIFWNQKSFDFMCEKYDFKKLEYRRCSHKGRRDLSFINRIATALVVKLAKVSLFQQAMLTAGKGDPLRFARPSLMDHAFVVLEKLYVQSGHISASTPSLQGETI